MESEKLYPPQFFEGLGLGYNGKENGSYYTCYIGIMDWRMEAARLLHGLLQG